MALVNFNNLLISDVLGKKPRYKIDRDIRKARRIQVNDLAGVEIELEGWRCDDDTYTKIVHGGWTEHPEGSLVNGREFVLHPPKNGDELEATINLFFESKCQYVPTERASVHIHLDMLNDFKIGQFRSLTVLTYVLEGAIYRIADENRKWASYSCPLTDMRVDRFNGLLQAYTPNSFKVALAGAYHEEKYYGFNAVSLTKHGTIEFRYFPCTRDIDDMYKWLNLCLELKHVASKFEDPRELAKQLTTPADIEAFIKKHFKQSAEHLLMYLDAVDAAARSLCCAAILNDKNAVKQAHVPDATDKPSKSFSKMASIVFRPIHEREELKRKHNAIDMSMMDVYQNFLHQAKQANHPNLRENP